MSGDKSPAAEWIDRHGNALYRYALRHARDPDLAADLVQETLLAALEKRESFRGDSSERTWLIAILRNKFVDHVRRQAREKPLDDLPEQDAEIDAMFDSGGHWQRAPASWPRPDEALANEEFRRAFNDCLESLPERIASAFYMAEIEGLDGPGICKVLDVSPSNVWVMLHRARMRLRRCLEKNWFIHGS